MEILLYTLKSAHFWWLFYRLTVRDGVKESIEKRDNK